MRLRVQGSARLLVAHPTAWSALVLSSGLCSRAEIFRAGAAASNTSPWLGPSINGGMRDHKADHIRDELHGRAVFLDDGKTRIAIVVVDSCMVPREVVTAAKKRIKS